MNHLISIVSYQDPTNSAPVEGVETFGPLISILNQHDFDKCVLLCFEGMQEQAKLIEQAIAKLHDKLNVAVVPMGACNMRNVQEVLAALNQYADGADDFSIENQIHINASSGTPESITASLIFAQENPLITSTLQVTIPLETGVAAIVSEWVPVREGELAEKRSPLFAVAEPEELFLDDIIEEIGLVGEHPSFRRVLNVAETRAKSSPYILVEGELGTGKQTYAKLLYKLSDRRDGPFYQVDCEALADPEIYLFGSISTDVYAGCLEKANGAVLHLMNIDDLPKNTQKRLLKYIQLNTSESSHTEVPDVRLIISSNRNLREEVARGKFREDLYRLLDTNSVTMPSLSERTSDIPRLAQYTLDRINGSLAKPKRFSKAVLDYLEEREWPGNMRELDLAIERAALTAAKSTIDISDFEPKGKKKSDKAAIKLIDLVPPLYEGFSIEDYLSDIRRNIFDKALELAAGNQSKAARMLGVTPQAVHKYIRIRRDKNVY